MDTSDQYVRMCDCEEVQGEWSKIKPIELTHTFWAVIPPIGKWKAGWTTHRSVFLPRQDQIQEWMQDCFRDINETVQDFKSFVTHWDKACPTFEQLWLAFYMAEEHGKLWDGEKRWV